MLSAGIHSPYSLYASDPDLKTSYSLKNAADAAGLYNDVAADFMSEIHAPIKFIHAAPGLVATRWGTEMPWAVRMAVRLLQKAGKSSADCAEFMLSGLINPDLANRRFYLMNQDGSEAKPTKLHAEAKDSVKAHTMDVLNRLLS